MTQQQTIQAGPFLPSPRVPRSPHPPSSLVASVAGETLAQPIAELEAAVTAAEEAVSELERARPGGPGNAWGRAMQADAAAYAAGTRPRKWKAGLLLEGDPQRWANACAACRSISLVGIGHCEQQLDRARIASTADLVAEAKGEAWARAAGQGWESHEDRSTGWRFWREGEQLLEQYAAAREINAWATGVPVREDVGSAPPYFEFLPPDSVARGQWLALDLALNSDRSWLRLPDPTAVQLPEESGQLVERAVGENMKRLVALRETGVYEAQH